LTGGGRGSRIAPAETALASPRGTRPISKAAAQPGTAEALDVPAGGTEAFGPFLEAYMAYSAASAVVLVIFHWCTLPPAAAPDPPRVTVEFRRAETKPADGLTEAAVVGSGQKVYLHKAAEITNTDIAKAFPGLSDDRKYEVHLQFTKDGAKKMAKLSEAHRGKPLAILVDGKVVCAPVLLDIITEYASISGSFTREEVERIAKGIAAK
jgi:hypothetical protein